MRTIKKYCAASAACMSPQLALAVDRSSEAYQQGQMVGKIFVTVIFVIAIWKLLARR